MKIQSTIEPQGVEVNGDKLWIHTNVTQVEVDNMGSTSTMYEYDRGVVNATDTEEQMAEVIGAEMAARLWSELKFKSDIKTQWIKDKRAEHAEDEIEVPFVEWIQTQDLAEPEVSEQVDEYMVEVYAKLRKAEYDKLNQFEMMYNDQQNGTNTWIEAVDAIKAKWPKGE